MLEHNLVHEIYHPAINLIAFIISKFTTDNARRIGPKVCKKGVSFDVLCRGSLVRCPHQRVIRSDPAPGPDPKMSTRLFHSPGKGWGKRIPSVVAVLDRLLPAMDAKFLVDVGRVTLDRSVRDDQVLRDFFGAEALGQQFKHFHLTVGQWLDKNRPDWPQR